MRNFFGLVGLIIGITSSAVAGGHSPKHKHHASKHNHHSPKHSHHASKHNHHSSKHNHHSPKHKHHSKKHRIVHRSVSAPASEIERTVFTVQQGKNAFNRFNVVHLQGDVERGSPPVILLAPFGFPAEFWEQSDDGSYLDAFAPQIALAGYDVWLVDSRLAAAAPGECESGAVDCSPMEEWGMKTAVGDALFVTGLARSHCRGEKPVIGGLSGGSAAALAAVNERPHHFSGLFLWEGTLVSDDPDISSRNAAFCQDDELALDAGTFYDASVQIFKALFSLAATDPEGVTPISAFPPGTTNLQALLFALSTPDPTNPLNFTESFVRFVGDPLAGTLAYSDIHRMVEMGALAGNYAPVAFIRDSHCSMGGVETQFTDKLDRFQGDVLIFAEGLGFNTMMLDTGTRLTRADVTIDYQPTFGESDRFFNTNWETVALDPLLAWLD